MCKWGNLSQYLAVQCQSKVVLVKNSLFVSTVYWSALSHITKSITCSIWAIFAPSKWDNEWGAKRLHGFDKPKLMEEKVQGESREHGSLYLFLHGYIHTNCTLNQFWRNSCSLKPRRSKMRLFFLPKCKNCLICTWSFHSRVILVDHQFHISVLQYYIFM